MAISEKLRSLWLVRDLRNRILFVLGILVLVRIAAHLPLPGVDLSALARFFQSNQLLGLLNLFSGGGLENFSIVALGVGPYITASIIFQLLTMIVPALERLSKEGERGQRLINRWTRWLTLPLAALQSYATISILKQQGQGILGNLSPLQLATAIISISAGSMLLLWMGELISEKKIGNGVSLLIFAGIVAGFPQQVQQTLAVFDSSKVLSMVLLVGLGLVTVAGVVFITEAQRNIPVSYARRIRGNRVFGGVDSHLPLRVNQAGVIPIIFAISIILFPPLIAQFFVGSPIAWLAASAQWVVAHFQQGPLYSVLYFILVVAFTYFYTAVVFHPQQIGENLQKSGGFVPGIRPGRQTAEYLAYVSSRTLIAGALFLGLIAILPNIAQGLTGITTIVLGGTSLLIVVSVVIETVKQIEAQLVMRDYEGF